MATSPSRLAPLLSVPAAAERLGISIRTVRRMIDAGELHVHRLGRSIRISEEDIVLLLLRSRK